MQMVYHPHLMSLQLYWPTTSVILWLLKCFQCQGNMLWVTLLLKGESFHLFPCFHPSQKCLNLSLPLYFEACPTLQIPLRSPVWILEVLSTGSLTSYVTHLWSTTDHGYSFFIALDTARYWQVVACALLAKLPSCGICPFQCNFITSFVSARTISVVIESKTNQFFFFFFM